MEKTLKIQFMKMKLTLKRLVLLPAMASVLLMSSCDSEKISDDVREMDETGVIIYNSGTGHHSAEIYGHSVSW